MSNRHRLTVAAAMLAATDAPAQEVRNTDAPNEAGAQLLSIVGLAATPDITASRLEPVDSDELSFSRIDTLRLGNDISIPFRNGTLYLEGNVGFARATADFSLGDTVAQDINFDAIGAFGFVGPDFAVGRFTHVRPLLILGVGYVADDFGLPEALQGAPNEIDLDLRQWSAATGFGLSIDHEQPLGDDLIDLRLKLSQIYLSTIWAADDRLSADTSNQTINANAAYKYDTGIRVGSYPLLLTGLLGANAFLGDQQDALGFSWFAEYGGGLELDLREADAAVQRARFRVTGIAGESVTGISFGVGIGF